MSVRYHYSYLMSSQNNFQKANKNENEYETCFRFHAAQGNKKKETTSKFIQFKNSIFKTKKSVNRNIAVGNLGTRRVCHPRFPRPFSLPIFSFFFSFLSFFLSFFLLSFFLSFFLLLHAHKRHCS